MNWTTLKRWAPLIMIILNSVGVAGVLLGFGETILQFTALNLLINGGTSRLAGLGFSQSLVGIRGSRWMAC